MVADKDHSWSRGRGSNSRGRGQTLVVAGTQLSWFRGRNFRGFEGETFVVLRAKLSWFGGRNFRGLKAKLSWSQGRNFRVYHVKMSLHTVSQLNEPVSLAIENQFPSFDYQLPYTM